MKKYITIIVLAILSFGLNAQSENLDDKHKEYPIVKALIGDKWTGSGVLMGKEATFTMDWQRVLGNKFLKLEFQNERKSEDDKNIVFNATAFYKIVNDSTVVGNWFDIRGMTFPLKGSLTENELTIFWGNEETEMGKTIYYFSNNNVITVEDFVMNKGEYFKFGSAQYNIKD
ncbi:MAG: hypothetical protein HKN51_01700 [Saprospiraceae bacterium]|nr:hypothetical protein [Saprospiraceae bacterium]